MADDDKVYRLTVQLVGGEQFTVQLKNLSDASIAQLGKIADADLKLTSTLQQNAQKRATTRTQETAAANVNTSRQAATMAAGGATAVFPPATMREATSLGSTLQRQLNTAERTSNPLQADVTKAQDSVAKLTTVLAQLQKGTEQYTRVSTDLALANQNLVVSIEKVGAAARKLIEEIDPLGAAYRNYGLAVSTATELQKQNAITIEQQSEATRQAKFDFEATASSVRKEAQTTYDQLIQSSARLKAALNNERVAGTPEAQIPQAASVVNLTGQLQTGIATGQKVDPQTIQSAQQFSKELNDIAAAEEAVNTAAMKLKDTLDPIAAVQRNLNTTLAQYDDLLAKNKISEDQATDAKNRANAAAKSTIQDLSGVTSAQDDYAKLSQAAQDYQEHLNPLLEAQRRYNEAIAQQKEFVSVGLLPQKQATATIEDFTAKLKTLNIAQQEADAKNLTGQQILKTYRTQINQAAIDTGSFGETSGKAFALSRGGLLELQASGVNAFQSLAAGISPLRTFETEGAQVLGGLIQLGLPIKTFISYVAPVLAVAAAFGVVAAAIGSAVSRATELKQLNVALETFHPASILVAKDLEDVQKHFEKTGESATILKTAIAELSRNPNINPAAIGSIIGVSQNLGAALGTDTAGGIKELITALDGGAEGILNLGNKLRALTVDQGAEILKLNDTGHAQEAVAKGYDLIAAHLRPYQESLGPVQELGRAITTVWNTFIESIKDSEPVLNAVKYIDDLTKKLTTLNDELKNKQATGTETAGTGAFAGGLRGGVIGALAGAGVGAAVGTPIPIVGNVVGGAEQRQQQRSDTGAKQAASLPSF